MAAPNALQNLLPNMVSGHGIWLHDDRGNTYLDGCSGAIVSNLGHGNTRVLAAQVEQAAKLTFAFRSQMTTPALLQLKNKVLELCPRYEQVLFFNSGSEAIEAAMRIARLYWQAVGQAHKSRILSRTISYHGMTEGALSLSGHNTRRLALPPHAQNANVVASPYCLRCPFGLKREMCDLQCATHLRSQIAQAGEQVGAFLFEPVIGASGAAIPSPEGYLHEIAAIAEHQNILLIADEVMTGFGRVGEWLALDRFGVTADISVLGKGLGAGYAPISAVLISPRVWSVLQASPLGGLIFGHTYGGNPLSCATAVAVIRELEENDILANVRRMSPILRARLQSVAEAHAEHVAEVRGEGFLFGLELERGLTAARLTEAALARGLFIYPCTSFRGVHGGEAIVVAPPLVSGETDLIELALRLNRAFMLALEEDNVTA